MSELYRWDNLPEQRDWMMEHAADAPSREVCEAFEREFGTPISCGQVTHFRQKYGLARRNASRAARNRHVPIGSEAKSNGYTKIKVRELPSRRGAHDNWVPKHRWVWEQAHGCEVPDDTLIMFADGDKGNFDPDNLVAVPRKYAAALNSSGLKWHDAGSMRAALAVVMLDSSVRDVANRPRKCGVCGRVFTPDTRPQANGRTQRTCRECLEKGLYAPKCFTSRTVECPVCGRLFTASNHNRMYCSKECLNKAMRRKRKEREAK